MNIFNYWRPRHDRVHSADLTVILPNRPTSSWATSIQVSLVSFVLNAPELDVC